MKSNSTFGSPGRRLGAIISCTVVAFLATFACHADRPPSPEEIFETMDRFWKHRNFEDFDTYVASLIERYPTYVPAMAANLVRTYHQGAQSELLVDGLEALELVLKKYPAHVPFQYRKTVRSIREEQEHIIEVYEERGQSAEDRLEKFKPENAFTGYGLLFPVLVTSAATVSLPQLPGEDVIIHDFRTPGQYNFVGVELDSLVELAKKSINPDECHAAIHALGTMNAEHAVPRLAELINSCTPYASEFAAVRISIYDTKAIPALLEILNAPGPNSRLESAVFALLKIGELTPEVEDALTVLTSKKTPVGQYAQEALVYLRRER